MNRDYSYQQRLQLVIYGESQVGKSSMVARFIQNNYSSSVRPTAGLDFFTRQIILDDEFLKLQIIGCSGDLCYWDFTSSYARGADAFVLVYDATDLNSLHGIKQWHQMIQN